MQQKKLFPHLILPFFRNSIPLIGPERRRRKPLLIKEIPFPGIIGPSITDSCRGTYSVLPHYHLIPLDHGPGIVKLLIGPGDLKPFEITIFIMHHQPATRMRKSQNDLISLRLHGLIDRTAVFRLLPTTIFHADGPQPPPPTLLLSPR